MRHRYLLQLCIFALVALAPLCGQTGKSNWDNVKQLRTGEQIKIVLNDGKSRSGELESASDEGLVVFLSSSETKFMRAEVRRILVKGQSHRGRNTAIGAGLAAGVGLGVGAFFDNQLRSWVQTNRGLAIGPSVGGVVGAAIGAVAPTGRWREVYRVK